MSYVPKIVQYLVDCFTIFVWRYITFCCKLIPLSGILNNAGLEGYLVTNNCGEKVAAQKFIYILTSYFWKAVYHIYSSEEALQTPVNELLEIIDWYAFV